MENQAQNDIQILARLFTNNFGRAWVSNLTKQQNWSSAQHHAVIVLLLNLVGFFISTRPRWSTGNVLYHSCTSFEGASRGGQPLNIFTWLIGAVGYWPKVKVLLEDFCVQTQLHTCVWVWARTMACVYIYMYMKLGLKQNLVPTSDTRCRESPSAWGTEHKKHVHVSFILNNGSRSPVVPILLIARGDGQKN